MFAIDDGTAFATNFHKGSNFGSEIDMKRNPAFSSFTLAFLCLNCGIFLTQDGNRSFNITFGFNKGFLAIHHGSIGSITQRFNNTSGYSAHTNSPTNRPKLMY